MPGFVGGVGLDDPDGPQGMREAAMKSYTQPLAAFTFGNDVVPDGGNDSIDLPFPLDGGEIQRDFGWPMRIWDFADDDVAVVQVLNIPNSVFVDESQSLTAIYPIKGELQGNLFSVKGDDGLRLTLTSEFALAGESANSGTFVGGADLPSNAQEVVNAARRIITGEVTDLLLLAKTEQTPDIVSNLSVQIQMQQPTTFASIVLMDVWNHVARRWQIVAGAIIEGDQDDQGDIELELEAPMQYGRARQFINSDGFLWARAYTWSPGAGPFGGVPEYDILIDRIIVDFETTGDDTP